MALNSAIIVVLWLQLWTAWKLGHVYFQTFCCIKGLKALGSGTSYLKQPQIFKWRAVNNVVSFELIRCILARTHFEKFSLDGGKYLECVWKQNNWFHWFTCVYLSVQYCLLMICFYNLHLKWLLNTLKIFLLMLHTSLVWAMKCKKQGAISLMY